MTKLGDMTLNQLADICSKHGNCECCPLENIVGDCYEMGMALRERGILDQEVEL